jgi:hypothetical protein
VREVCDEIRAEVEPAVERLIEITKANQNSTRELLDWLRIEHGIEKPGQALEDFPGLDSDSFVREVRSASLPLKVIWRRRQSHPCVELSMTTRTLLNSAALKL